jgi:hypothetical protein
MCAAVNPQPLPAKAFEDACALKSKRPPNVVSSTSATDDFDLEKLSAKAAAATRPNTAHRTRCLIGAAVGVVVLVALAVALPLALLLPGSSGSGDDGGGNTAVPMPSLAYSVERFDDCAQLATALQLWPAANANANVQLSNRYSRDDDVGDIIPFAEPVFAEAADAAPSAGNMARSEGAAESSSTNVQVEGLDEGDLVKNDGTYIYSVGGHQLVIVRAHPVAQRDVVSRTPLYDGASGAAANGAGAGGEAFALYAAEELLLSSSDTLLVLANVQVAARSACLHRLRCCRPDVATPPRPGRLSTGPRAASSAAWPCRRGT